MKGSKNLNVIDAFLSLMCIGVVSGTLFILPGCAPDTSTAPHILYIAPDPDEYDQLFSIPSTGEYPAQLTTSPLGIWDYAVAPNGDRLVYSRLRADGGSGLWHARVDGRRQRKLLDCAPASCTGPAWSPDGARLIYERQTPDAQAPQLWQVNPDNGKTSPLLEDSEAVGFAAQWSPDGQWVSYVAPEEQGIRIYNLNTGRDLLIPTSIEAPGTWSPTSEALVLANLRWEGGFVSHLVKVDVKTGWLTNLSDSKGVEEDAPAWSPNGAWIAYRRKAARTSMGKQIWVMRSDGSEAHPLTEDVEYYHGAPVWSSDGQALLFTRHKRGEIKPSMGVWQLSTTEAPVGIWQLDIETEHMQQIAVLGLSPTWVP